MIRRKEREIKVIYVIVLALFAAFLAIPMVRLLIESFVEEAGVGLSYYTEVLTERGFMKALTNSITVSFASALISTVLAFILAYSIQYGPVSILWTKKLKDYADFFSSSSSLCCGVI